LKTLAKCAAASHFFPPITEKKAGCTKLGNESGIAGDIAAMARCATAWPAWHAGRVRRYRRDAKLRRDVADRVLKFYADPMAREIQGQRNCVNSVPYLDGPKMRAVDKEIIRGEFYKEHPAEGETHAQRQEVRRRAFNHVLSDAQTVGDHLQAEDERLENRALAASIRSFSCCTRCSPRRWEIPLRRP
jgi:hypothetical protein